MGIGLTVFLYGGIPVVFFRRLKPIHGKTYRYKDGLILEKYVRPEGRQRTRSIPSDFDPKNRDDVRSSMCALKGLSVTLFFDVLLCRSISRHFGTRFAVWPVFRVKTPGRVVSQGPKGSQESLAGFSLSPEALNGHPLTRAFCVLAGGDPRYEVPHG
jgi:hypothetical protein